MGFKETQQQVDKWIKDCGNGYWQPHEMLASLAEETGEVAREVNHIWGPKKKKSTEELKDFSDELADVIFTIICIANSQGINLDEAFGRKMDKCYQRDKNRFEKKQV
jgi:NTP pyrophosphatase (non-canonical NTP hydrolase)